MDRRKIPSSVDIQKVLLDMREYRMGLIQTPDQLRFSYMAVIEGAKRILTDSSATEVRSSLHLAGEAGHVCEMPQAHFLAGEMIFTMLMSSSANKTQDR